MAPVALYPDPLLKISHLGQLYESELGDDTVTIATAIDSFDPNPGWSLVVD